MAVHTTTGNIVPKLFFVSWWETFVNLFSINGWLMVLYFIFLLVLITATIYFLSRKAYLQRWSFLSGIALFLLFAVSLLFYILKFKQDTSQNYAVVIESSVTVKTSPDDQSNDAFIIHEGLKLKLSDQIGNWFKIQLVDGKVGWLQESNIKII